MKVLVVCTANRCRSPMGEVLLQAALNEKKVKAKVTSAGVLKGGIPAEPEAVEAVAELGLDLSKHVSRQLTPAIVGDTNLILTMTRSHVRDIAVMNPSAFPRTFTVPEFLMLAERSWPLDERNAQRVLRVSQGRKPSELMVAGPEYDIADPIGQPLAVFQRSRDEIKSLMDKVAHLLGQ